MHALQLIPTICFFIISIVLSLLLALMSRKFQPESIRLPLAFHLVLASFTLVFSFTFPGQVISEYLLLFTVCSGLALAGWALRNSYPGLLLKIYLGIYLVTIPVFFWSPSLLFYTISGNYGLYHPEQEFKLRADYYLMEQQSMLKARELPVRYKVIQKFGIYNKTLARDLDFGKTLARARLIELTEDTLIIEGQTADNQKSRIGLKPGMNKNKIIRKPK